MTEVQRRIARREAIRLTLGGVLIGCAIVCGAVAILTGERKWLLMLALIPLAGMLQWHEDCPRCGRSLRPATLAPDGTGVCVRCHRDLYPLSAPRVIERSAHNTDR